MLNASTKLFVPKERLATKYGRGWMGDNSVRFVKTLGALELLAAVGLILPAALDIAPVLMPSAAVGVVLLMVGATIVHLRRGESCQRVEPDLSRYGRLRSVGPLRPRVILRLTAGLLGDPRSNG